MKKSGWNMNSVREIACLLLMFFAIYGFADDPLELKPGRPPETNEIFYASFDTPAKADKAYGNPLMVYDVKDVRTYKPENEKYFISSGTINGRALNLNSPSMSACFSAFGNICPKVGTLCLWYKYTAGNPTVTVYNPSSHYIFEMPAWIISPPAPGNAGHIYISQRDMGNFDYKIPQMEIDKKSWHLLAFVWDECAGVRLYLDGRKIFNAAEPFYPGYPYLGRITLTKGIFDDLRIWDRAFTDKEIETLYSDKKLPALSAAKTGSADGIHRMTELGWKDMATAVFIPVNGATFIEKLDIPEVKTLKNSNCYAIDGREKSSWPSQYKNYDYMGGGSLDISLASSRGFNYLRCTGKFDAGSLLALKPGNSAAAEKLFSFSGKDFYSTMRLPELCSSEKVSVSMEKSRYSCFPSMKKIHGEPGRLIHDLEFFNVQPFDEKDFKFAGKEKLYLVPSGNSSAIAGKNLAELVSWYRPEDRKIFFAQTENKNMKQEKTGIKAMRFFHIMVARAEKDIPLGAIRLRLHVDGWKTGNKINLRLHDPVNSGRFLLDADLEMKQDGGMDITMVFPPTIIPAGRELWLSLIALQDGEILCGNGASAINVYETGAEEASRSYYNWQSRLLADDFRVFSELRPWGYNSLENDIFLRIYRPNYDLIAAKVLDLYRRFPGDTMAQGYMMFIHPRDRELWKRLPAPKLENPGLAPEWAALENALLKNFLAFASWWIDQRQVADGEFGSDYGDDTDLVQDWLSLSMICDPGHKLKKSLRLLADYVWGHAVKNGLNTRKTDVLHAYEEGMNIQPAAFLMDYGNPVLFERFLATARRYDGFLFYPSKDGRRVLKGSVFSNKEVEEGSTKLNDYSHLILHPALIISWYNGDRKMLKLIEEFYDGNKSLFSDKKDDIPFALYRETGNERFKIKKAENNARWVRYMNLKEISDKDLEYMKNYDFNSPAIYHASGRTYELGFGDNEPLISYIAWHFCRDKKVLVPALEQVYKSAYYNFPLQTLIQQSADRVPVRKNLTDFMYLGGMPGSRNRIYPHFAVSYEDLNSDFAALVLEDRPELLRWVGYNLGDKPQKGKLRVWNLIPGKYEVRTGIDVNGDDVIDRELSKKEISLLRRTAIPVDLPPRESYILEARLLQKDSPLHERCDLAVCADDAVRKGKKLAVTVHNIGCCESGPFKILLCDKSGRSLGGKTHSGLKGIENLNVHRQIFEFDNIPERETVYIKVEGRRKEITDENNSIFIPGENRNAGK